MKRSMVIFCLIALASLTRVSAQQTPIQQQRDRLIADYEKCVMISSLGYTGDLNMVAEQAFIACQTEEQAIRVFFSLGQVQRTIADSIIVRKKLEMKRIIRKDPQH